MRESILVHPALETPYADLIVTRRRYPMSGGNVGYHLTCHHYNKDRNGQPLIATSRMVMQFSC